MLLCSPFQELAAVNPLSFVRDNGLIWPLVIFYHILERRIDAISSCHCLALPLPRKKLPVPMIDAFL